MSHRGTVMEQTRLDMDERFIREAGIAADVSALAQPVLEELGFDLVRTRIMGQDGTTVQIMIENAGGSISVDDCAEVSRRLSPLLDAHDPMPGGYNLEISSPGLARPLVRPRDFVTWAGHEARLELKELVDGRRRFKGVIEGFEDGEVRLRTELEGYDAPQVIGLAVGLIEEAKLAIDDTALKKALKKKPA